MFVRNLTKGMLVGSVFILVACGGGKSTTTASSQTTASQPAAAEAKVDTAALAAKGAPLYQATCAACHGPSGKGDGPGAANLNPKPRDFTNKEYMTKLNDTDIRNTIKYGGAIKSMPQMPSHPQFGDEDLSALVAYVRSMSGTQTTTAGM